MTVYSRATWAMDALWVIAGLLAALVAATATLFVIFYLWFWLDDPEALFAGGLGLAWTIAYLGVASALSVVFVGTPLLYLTFRRLRWYLPGQSAAGGAVLGALVLPANLIMLGQWEGLFSLESLGVGL